jgi:hypothetical protein
MTPSGIEPATCQFLAYCLNRYTTMHLKTGNTMQIKIVHDHNNCHGIVKGTGRLNGCATYILLLAHSYATHVISKERKSCVLSTDLHKHSAFSKG